MEAVVGGGSLGAVCSVYLEASYQSLTNESSQVATKLPAVKSTT